jgi:hypothetical protein
LSIEENRRGPRCLARHGNARLDPGEGLAPTGNVE